MSMDLDRCDGCDGRYGDVEPCVLCEEAGDIVVVCHNCRIACEDCRRIVCTEHAQDAQCRDCANAGGAGEAWSGGFAENH